MAIHRIRIDYSVYPPDFVPGTGKLWETRTIAKARLIAKKLGAGSLVYTNFNQTNKKGEVLGGFWDGKVVEWTGTTFRNVTAKMKNVIKRGEV
jgi:hypothetical protein